MQTPSWHTIKNALWIASTVLVAAVVASILAVWSLVRGHTTASTLLFRAVSPVTWTLSRFTLRSVDSLEVWDEGVWLGKTAGITWHTVQKSDDASLSDRLTILLTALPAVTTHTARFSEKFAHSWLLSRLVQNHAELAKTLTADQALLAGLNTAVVNRSRFLVLLENTDEVRATGGFMGSYTTLDFGSPTPLQLAIRDIYDPSGVSITLPSPPGQKEYLSEGKGMKLVDANWNPDFPQSAEQILSYFQQLRTTPEHYDGVIAVPLSVVEKLLTALGGVYLPDQQQTVTADTFAQLVRQDRTEFFPGSQEKTQSLQSFATALTLKLSQLSLAGWWRVWQSLSQDQTIGEVQLFATDPTVETQFHAAGVAGTVISSGPDDLFIFPVESNVGINKANRKVSRTLTAYYEPSSLTLVTQFHNAYTLAERPTLPLPTGYQQAPHLSYVNYYRLLVGPNLVMQRMTVNGKPVILWDEQTVVTSEGEPLIQLGFLAVVPEEKTIEVVAYFKAPQLQHPHLIIQKQVGVDYDFVSFACFGNYFHSPLQLLQTGRVYQGTCGESVQ